MEKNTVIEKLRRFAPLDYRYQLEDALVALTPLTDTKIDYLKGALSDHDADVRFLAQRIIDALDADSIADCYEPRLTVEQLITLLREPHPDHDFFDPEPNEVQRQLRTEFSPDAIQHVALSELVEVRAREAVPDILILIEDPSTSPQVRLHAARAVYDITGAQHRRLYQDAAPQLQFQHTST